MMRDSVGRAQEVLGSHRHCTLYMLWLMKKFKLISVVVPRAT